MLSIIKKKEQLDSLNLPLFQIASLSLLQPLSIMTYEPGLFQLLARAMSLLLNWILYSKFGFWQVDALHLWHNYAPLLFKVIL